MVVLLDHVFCMSEPLAWICGCRGLALFMHSDSRAHAVASMRDSCLFISAALTAYQYVFLATPKELFLKAWFHFCRLRTAREPLGPHAVASQ